MFIIAQKFELEFILLIMRKKSIKVLSMLVLAGTVATGCQLLKDVQYEVTPDPLEMHADSVNVRVSVNIPPKSINKKAVVEVTPYLGDQTLETILFQGEKATGNGQVVYKTSGGTVTYETKVPYNPSMEASSLDVSGKLYKGSKEKGELERTKIGDATIITPYLVNKDFKVIYATDNFKRVTQHSFDAMINYDKGKYNVKPAEMKQADIAALDSFLNVAQTNPRIEIKSIQITGYASPEGGAEANSELSDNRAKSAMEATMKVAKSAKNDTAQVEAMYKLVGSGEDFSGFEKAVKASTMEQADQDLVIRTIQREDNPDQAEADAHDLAMLFKELDKDVFPALRRAEIAVIYDKIGFSDEELKALAMSKPDTLNLEELMYSATLFTDLNDKLKIYQHAEGRYGNEDARVANNVGAALYELNKVADSKAKFEKANGVEDNAISKNNLGAVAGVNGDREKAMELLNQANGAGSEVSYNKGILNIQNGDYDAAVGSFGEACFNKGLAQLLAGSASDGANTVDASGDESAKAYYLKAVAAARQDKAEGVVSNLKMAFGIDSSLKEKAMKDREFLKWFEDASFTAIVK